MSAFSFSAKHFTKEDEERELNELTDSERQAILADKYGSIRNNTIIDNVGNDDASNTNNGNNNDDNENDNGNDGNNLVGANDISVNLLTEFYNVLEHIPPEISGYYVLAWTEAEGIIDVETESDPIHFLRCENYNVERAAYRYCEYWKTRYDIFGETDFIKPMSLLVDDSDGDGGCAMKSIIPYMVQIPNFCRILPNDDSGRTVITIDKTNIKFKDHDDIVLIKIMWFVFHKALLEKPSTQENGIVLIIIDPTMNWDFPSTNFLELFSKTLNRSIPIKICCRHFCVSTLVATIIMPIVRRITTRKSRLRSEVHNCLHQHKMLCNMESFGLQRKNIPTSIGGHYNKKPSWVYTCEKIILSEKGRQRQEREQER